MMAERDALTAAFVVALGVGSASLLTMGVGYWILSLAVFAVMFVLVLAVGLSAPSGKWLILGMLAAFLLGFVLLAPVVCTNSVNGVTRTSCQAVIGLTLPGYAGVGSNFSPSFLPPVVAGGLAAVLVQATAAARHRKP